MRFALIFALAVAPIAVTFALPDSAVAAQPKKPKKVVPKAKTNGTNGTTPIKDPLGDRKEPERTVPKINESPSTGQAPELRGPTRIDFDDRLIQGQTNKSGAVYLFDRKETGISS